MTRHLSSIFAAAVLLTFGWADAAPATAPQTIERTEDGPLTLTRARQIVDRSLRDHGERMLRAGRSEFVGNGDVRVEIVSLQGVPYRTVIVDGRTRAIIAARAQGKSTGAG